MADLPDYDLSEISESSYADARADTPTLGEHHSGSEDTLSNLSLEILDGGDLDEDPRPEEPPGTPHANATSPSSTSASFVSACNGSANVRVCVTDADLEMADSTSLDLPPGAQYLPTSVDFPRSPSQLILQKGPSFMPKEDPGVVSEDESSVSSYQAILDLNGEVRVTKKDKNAKNGNNSFTLPQIILEDTSQPESLVIPFQDGLDDYIEDFILPLSHESVMSRQLSFRRKVKNTYDEIAKDKASQELDKFEAMLATYEEEDEYQRSPTPEAVPVPKARKPQFEISHSIEPPSLLDIDAIVKENAPGLMFSVEKDQEHEPSFNGTPPDLESLSSYFLPQQTIDKLYAVYESSNFNNIYCLSGEIKNILTAIEIEEILENKEHLEQVLDPNVMAALHWSLNPVSLALPQPSKGDNDNENDNEKQKETEGEGLKSKSSSMSNGFHSDASEDDSQKSDSPGPRNRGAPLTGSMRRKIGVPSTVKKPDDDEDLLDEIDLGVGDEDWDDEERSTTSSRASLSRKDSKRFSFKGKDGRVVEAVFEESLDSNPKGTLRRIKAPLNLTADNEEVDVESPTPSPEPPKHAKSHKHTKKRIAVDENILSMMSSAEFEDGDLSQATNVTQSDIFYSIRNSSAKDDEDPTMRTENLSDEEDDVTLDIDTPDDMEDSIMGQLDSIAVAPDLPHDDSLRWKSYRVGPTDIQIDLQAIHPYRKCLSHGGFFDAEKSIAIILFSGCFLPDRTQPSYTYLMDHLFLYVLSTLEELITEDYILVYLHGGTPKSCVPSYGWLRKCYQLIDHRLKKNLKGLYLVHPTFWLRTVVALTRPFVSTKFRNKVRFVNTLSELCLELPTEHLGIPDSVLHHDAVRQEIQNARNAAANKQQQA